MGAARTRVLHVLPDLAIGGGQTIVLNHLLHADRSRYDIDVALLGGPGELTDAFTAAGSPPEVLPRGNAAQTVAAIRKRLRLVDLAHVHSDVDRKLTQVASLGTGVPVVGHLHAEWVHLGPKLPSSPTALDRARSAVTGGLRDAVERHTVAHYVAESADVARVFRPLVGQPITVLRQAIPVDRYEGAAERARAAGLRDALQPGTGPLLVNVSRMVPGKGHLLLLESFATLVSTVPDAVLALVGDGPERAASERRAAELGIDGSVRFLGNRHDVPDLLTVADVFVFASESEGFGLAVLEAMAASKPVVAFRLPAIEEFASDGESALLVERGDAASFANAVEKILGDPVLGARLGRAGRGIVESRFPADAVARTFEEVYETVLAGRTRRREKGRP